MVAEELARIVQSELAELRQRNVAETTTRIRLENQLGELKVHVHIICEDPRLNLQKEAKKKLETPCLVYVCSKHKRLE